MLLEWKESAARREGLSDLYAIFQETFLQKSLGSNTVYHGTTTSAFLYSGNQEDGGNEERIQIRDISGPSFRALAYVLLEESILAKESNLDRMVCTSTPLLFVCDFRKYIPSSCRAAAICFLVFECIAL